MNTMKMWSARIVETDGKSMYIIQPTDKDAKSVDLNEILAQATIDENTRVLTIDGIEIGSIVLSDCEQLNTIHMPIPNPYSLDLGNLFRQNMKQVLGLAICNMPVEKPIGIIYEENDERKEITQENIKENDICLSNRRIVNYKDLFVEHEKANKDIDQTENTQNDNTPEKDEKANENHRQNENAQKFEVSNEEKMPHVDFRANNGDNVKGGMPISTVKEANFFPPEKNKNINPDVLRMVNKFYYESIKLREEYNVLLSRNKNIEKFGDTVDSPNKKRTLLIGRLFRLLLKPIRFIYNLLASVIHLPNLPESKYELEIKDNKEQMKKLKDRIEVLGLKQRELLKTNNIKAIDGIDKEEQETPIGIDNGKPDKQVEKVQGRVSKGNQISSENEVEKNMENILPNYKVSYVKNEDKTATVVINGENGEFIKLDATGTRAEVSEQEGNFKPEMFSKVKSAFSLSIAMRNINNANNKYVENVQKRCSTLKSKNYMIIDGIRHSIKGKGDGRYIESTLLGNKDAVIISMLGNVDIQNLSNESIGKYMVALQKKCASQFYKNEVVEAFADKIQDSEFIKNKFSDTVKLSGIENKSDCVFIHTMVKNENAENDCPVDFVIDKKTFAVSVENIEGSDPKLKTIRSTIAQFGDVLKNSFVLNMMSPPLSEADVGINGNELLSSVKATVEVLEPKEGETISFSNLKLRILKDENASHQQYATIELFDKDKKIGETLSAYINQDGKVAGISAKDLSQPINEYIVKSARAYEIIEQKQQSVAREPLIEEEPDYQQDTEEVDLFNQESIYDTLDEGEYAQPEDKDEDPLTDWSSSVGGGMDER